MYTVSDGESKIMLEAGISIKRINTALGFQTTNLAGVLLSHSHKDHSVAIKDLVRLGVDCYMSKGTANELQINHHRIKCVEAKKTFRIGTFTILPFEVEHDTDTPFGYLIKSDNGSKLLFATDTYFIRYKFVGLNYLMLECNYCQSVLDANNKSGRLPKGLRQRIMKSHFSLENVLDFLRSNDLSCLQEIWLLHLSDSNSDEQLIRDEVAKVTGKMIHIP
ncbi:MBL fold metallo-hydrolase [Paenisporosarcina cavernae]